VLLGLLLGYGLGLLILGVWWRAVQEANAW
jgi:hypothetical protein